MTFIIYTIIHHIRIEEQFSLIIKPQLISLKNNFQLTKYSINKINTLTANQIENYISLISKDECFDLKEKQMLINNLQQIINLLEKAISMIKGILNKDLQDIISNNKSSMKDNINTLSIVNLLSEEIEEKNIERLELIFSVYIYYNKINDKLNKISDIISIIIKDFFVIDKSNYSIIYDNNISSLQELYAEI